jgi:hypothetical protein
MVATVGTRQFVRVQRTPPPHFLENPRRILGALFQNFLETPGAYAIGFAPVPEQGPRLHRDDRDFVSPVLGEIATSIDELVERRPIVRADAREGHHVLRRANHIHVVDLKQSQPANGVAEMLHRGARRPCTVEALCRERQTPGFAQRQ